MKSVRSLWFDIVDTEEQAKSNYQKRLDSDKRYNEIKERISEIDEELKNLRSELKCAI